MSRYFAKPKAWVADDVWDDPFLPDIRVSDHEATDTGLLDAEGNTIWRAPNPIGFGRNDEW
jgi:hypothetical protein